MNARAAVLAEELEARVHAATALAQHPDARPAAPALASAAAVALCGWAISGGPARHAGPVLLPERGPIAAPRPVAAPAQDPAPLVAYSPDRAAAPGEDGLVAWLLGKSVALPSSSLLFPWSSVESGLSDRRLPEHRESRLLRLFSWAKGLAPKRAAYVPPPEEQPAEDPYVQLFAGWRGSVVLGGRMGQGTVFNRVSAHERSLPVAKTSSSASKQWFGGTDDRSDAIQEVGPEMFPDWLLAVNPGKPICRAAGLICRDSDGTYFELETIEQTQRLFGRGLVVFPSPLVLDLDGDGVRTSDRKIRFDISGDGIVDELYDVSSKDGVLVFDADGNGLSGAHARELFGTETDLDGDGLPDGFSDGFQAFAAFVAKARREGALAAEQPADGWLSGEDLAALERRYGLRIRVGSLGAKAVSLAEAGVARMRVSSAKPRRIRNFDRQKNDLMRQEGAVFTRTDGTLGVYEDVWFRSLTPRELVRPGPNALRNQLARLGFGDASTATLRDRTAR